MIFIFRNCTYILKLHSKDVDFDISDLNDRNASGEGGINVAQALNRLRNDERFQINISSEIQRRRNNRTQDDTKVLTFGSDIDTSTVTETRFIEGISRTLQDLSTNISDKE